MKSPPSPIRQCLASNKRTGKRCSNSVLLEFIGPQPEYCAQHIHYQQDSLHTICSVGSLASTKNKGCREVVLKRFGVCHKHFDIFLDSFGPPEAFAGLSESLEFLEQQVLNLLSQNWDSGGADKVSYHRKYKILKKFQSMISQTSERMEKLFGQKPVSQNQKTMHLEQMLSSWSYPESPTHHNSSTSSSSSSPPLSSASLSPLSSSSSSHSTSSTPSSASPSSYLSSYSSSNTPRSSSFSGSPSSPRTSNIMTSSSSESLASFSSIPTTSRGSFEWSPSYFFYPPASESSSGPSSGSMVPPVHPLPAMSPWIHPSQLFWMQYQSQLGGMNPYLSHGYSNYPSHYGQTGSSPEDSPSAPHGSNAYYPSPYLNSMMHVMPSDHVYTPVYNGTSLGSLYDGPNFSSSITNSESQTSFLQDPPPKPHDSEKLRP